MSLLLLPDVAPSDGSGQTRRFMILVADWWPLGAYSHPQQSNQVASVLYRLLSNFAANTSNVGHSDALVAMDRL
jgi:hypothetical protein